MRRGRQSLLFLSVMFSSLSYLFMKNISIEFFLSVLGLFRKKATTTVNRIAFIVDEEVNRLS